MSNFNNQLVKTIISTTPNEKLAAIDVYGQKANSIINNLASFASKYGVDLGSIVSGASQITSMIPKVIETANRFNKGNLIERLSSLTNLGSGALPRLPDSIQSTINGTITNYGDYFTDIKGIVQAAEGRDFNKLSDIGQFINRFTGTNSIKLLDQDALGGLVTGLIKEAKDVGLGNVFSTITEGINDPNLLMKIASNTLPIAIGNSDIKMFDDISKALDYKNILNYLPDSISEFANKFKNTFNGIDGDILSLFNDINDTFNLVDKDWLKDSRLDGLESVLNGEFLSSASGDFKEVFGHGIKSNNSSSMSDLQAIYCTAQLTKSYSVLDFVNVNFPLMLNQKEGYLRTVNSVRGT